MRIRLNFSVKTAAFQLEIHTSVPQEDSASLPSVKSHVQHHSEKPQAT